MTRRATGLTIVEVVVSMLVVSSMLVAALYAVGASRMAVTRGRDRVLATTLADDLLGFIHRLPYKSASGSALGVELGNILGDKTTYDDVDDFDGWAESPPTRADGVVIAGLTEWRRLVTVEWVDPDDPAIVTAGETGVKRITVVVQKGGVELARRVALRTALSAAWE